MPICSGTFKKVHDAAVSVEGSYYSRVWTKKIERQNRLKLKEVLVGVIETLMYDSLTNKTKRKEQKTSRNSCGSIKLKLNDRKMIKNAIIKENRSKERQ